MDKRRNRPDREALRAQRVALYDAIGKGELTLKEAVRRMRALSGLEVRLVRKQGLRHE